MCKDTTAIMVVANHATARELSKRYSMNIYRFISIENLADKLIGRTGPLLFDLPAIVALAEL